MVRPRAFGVNRQTAATNRFQCQLSSLPAECRARATAEFDAVAGALDTAGVLPEVFDDTEMPETPDAVFPNNWVSFHGSGQLVLYPMHAPNRRLERRRDILDGLGDRGFRWQEVVDLAGLEGQALALEGTGSLVLDRPRRVAYAALSARTHPAALDEFGQRTGYRVHAFRTSDGGVPVYHTNVMLALGSRFAVVCAAVVDDRAERDALLAAIDATGREIIRIDAWQMHEFAANLLELDAGGRPVIALSARALRAFNAAQRRRLEAHAELLPVPLPVIEGGGGSLRCMLAEIFVPGRSAAGG
jgi:hypothetical protein